MSGLFSSISKMGQKFHSQFNQGVERTANKVTEHANKFGAKFDKPVEKDDIEHHGNPAESKDVVDGATKDKEAMVLARRKEAEAKAKSEGEPEGTPGAEGEGTKPKGTEEADPEFKKMGTTKRPSKMLTYAMVGAAAAPFVAMAGEGMANSGKNDDKKKDAPANGNGQ